MRFIFSFLLYTLLFACLSLPSQANVKGVARTTYYESYAFCCPKSPNYDPKAPTTECDDDSACDYLGDFAALGHQSYDYVKSHNLVSFYDNSDPSGSHFLSNYGKKTIRLTRGNITFDAVIADTCGNGDCNNCCSKNAAKTGYLVDVEYYTALRYFGSVTPVSDGTINFEVIDSTSDASCKTGIRSGNACCSKACGVCGGANCSARAGGADECCTGNIVDSNKSCNSHMPPCVVQTAAETV